MTTSAGQARAADVRVDPAAAVVDPSPGLQLMADDPARALHGWAYAAAWCAAAWSAAGGAAALVLRVA